MDKVILVALVLCLLTMLTSFAGNPEAQHEEPSLTLPRYDEDYSYLRNPANRTDKWWEPLKLIPLTEKAYLSLGGEFRPRFESIKNDNWGLGTDDAYLWVRFLPYADLHATDSIRLFGQFILAEAIGREPITSLDQNRADVLQGFGDLVFPVGNDGTLTLRGGRQLFIYGSGRLVDVRYGPNVLQPFDAMRAIIKTGSWRLDTFYSSPVAVETGAFDDETSDDSRFWGAYLTRVLPRIFAFGKDASTRVDVYYFGLHRDSAEFNGRLGDELRHTLGTRFFGQAQSWDWDLEGFYQFGRFASGSIRAWSFASHVGYTFRNLQFSPRIGFKANVISGDRDANDADIETFNPLFPKGKYFGELTPLGPENLINMQMDLSLSLTDKWTLLFTVVPYWRDSADDAIYDLGGNIVRPAGGSTAHFIGVMWEPVLICRFSRELEGLISYSQFHAGDFIKETGPDKTIRFVGMELLLKF
ncbi:MAG: alginate export family protein [Deltaproteobacteria bacterium]